MSRSSGIRQSGNSAISGWFGCNTFNWHTMETYLSKATIAKLRKVVDEGKLLDLNLANKVAEGMKKWALDRGATHYCHWFHPLTEGVAEKHDSFLTWQTNGAIMEQFGGKQLIQGEPDASSFPSGGLRSTYEARGYTVWDPASPPFLIGTENSMTLAIPTAFMGYHGEALDHKTPHLRSMAYLGKQCQKALETLFGKKTKKCVPQVGPEQEYFLIRQDLFESRMDLILTGRTLQGSRSARGQELEDHYFGTIKPRVLEFMSDLETSLYELGIPAKTRHNEVAPNQFEIAPIHEVGNVAADHNYLLMRLLEQVAQRHGLACLLHEKPFDGVNGSGKHNNWSISTAEGENLLEPGHTPQENVQFLFFLACVLKAIHTHGGLLGAAIARVGNDHRMGANEAPPNIISVFLGEQLTHVVAALEKGKTAVSKIVRTLDTGVPFVPNLSQDNTDRNRTSPFAFTGNKFEFRSPGSFNPIGVQMMVLNAAVGQAVGQLTAKAEAKIQKGKKKTDAVLETIRETIKATKGIRMEGDNYSEAWVKEAKKRGLPNIKNTPDSIKYWTTPSAKKVFKESGVLTPEELDARVNVRLEQYSKWINIEALTLIEMTESQLIGAIFEDIRLKTETLENLADIRIPTPKPVKDALKMQVKDLGRAYDLVDKLKKEREAALAKKSAAAEAKAFATRVKPACDSLREVLDELEGLTDAAHWPLPKYWEMLYTL